VRAIAGRIEWHHTPRHESWLNMAEIVPAAPTKQCLDWRIESLAELRRQITAWEEAREGGAQATHAGTYFCCRDCHHIGRRDCGGLAARGLNNPGERVDRGRPRG
jgi:hypothetical protein